MRLTITLFMLNCFVLSAQDLPRRTSWQANINVAQDKPGALIQSIEQGSPMDVNGLKTGDVIIMVNGITVKDVFVWSEITRGLRAEESIDLLVRRQSQTFIKSISLNPLPFERHRGLDTYYEALTSDYGIEQRVIITRPKNSEGKQPAIFLLQGLSCSSVEVPEIENNWDRMINDMVEKSGIVVMRIEKPGVGDSKGNCGQTDFHTELEGYRSALRYLKEKEYVDTSRIVIYGSSLGSALAPLLANEFNLSGIISDGTFFKTWFEHMLEIERRILKMNGNDESTIVKKMNETFIPLYYGMLIQKMSYGEVIDQYPALANDNYHPDNHMYGRPLIYYQQLQNFDLAGEWEKIQVPVRILYGTNDWIMSEYDNHMIMQVLDRQGHEDHQLHLYPGLDHWNTIHDTPENSFFGKEGTWDPKLPELVIRWVTEMVE